MMNNRTIHEGRTFYKVRDLATLHKVNVYQINKAIKQQEVPTETLIGFGNTRFVFEDDVSMIVINGESILMKTVVHDYREKLITTTSASLMANKFMETDKSKEEILEEASVNTIQEMYDLIVQSESKDDSEIEPIKVFNELAEKNGYANHVHIVDLIIAGKKTSIEFNVANDVIIGCEDNNTLRYLDSNYFHEYFGDGVFDASDDFDECDSIDLIKTENNNDHMTKKQAFVKLMEIIRNKKCSLVSIDYLAGIQNENNVVICKSLEQYDSDQAAVYFALIKGDFKYIEDVIQMEETS